MTTNTESAQVQIGLASQSSLSWRHLVPVLALFDALLIASTAIAIGSFYYLIKFETTIGFVSHLNFGLAVGLVFVLVRVLRGDYAFPIYATNFDFNRLGLAWLLTFLTLLSLFFLFKIGDEFSRGTAIGLFVTGPLVLAIQQLLFTRAASLAARSGRLALRRVYLIGGRDDVAEFRWSMEEQLSGLSIVGITAIDEAAGGEALDERLQAAVESAREALIEMVAEADEHLMEKFFEAGTLTDDELRSGLRSATITAKLFPLVCTSALANIGIQPLLDAMLAYLPSPADRPYPAQDASGAERTVTAENKNTDIFPSVNFVQSVGGPSRETRIAAADDTPRLDSRRR